MRAAIREVCGRANRATPVCCALTINRLPNTAFVPSPADAGSARLNATVERLR